MSATMDPARIAAAAAVDAMVGTKKKGPRSVSPSQIKREISEVRRRVEKDDWAGMRPGLLVAVYSWCHEETYGVPPGELRGTVWGKARLAAGKMVKREFGGDVEAAVEFLRWVWGREHDRERRRRDQGQETSRITWHSQFIRRYFLTDYRIFQSRKDGRIKR